MPPVPEPLSQMQVVDAFFDGRAAVSGRYRTDGVYIQIGHAAVAKKSIGGITLLYLSFGLDQATKQVFNMILVRAASHGMIPTSAIFWARRKWWVRTGTSTLEYAGDIRIDPVNHRLAMSIRLGEDKDSKEGKTPNLFENRLRKQRDNMSEHKQYEVFAGNVGMVRATDSKAEALKVYAHYVSLSQRGSGRAAGEQIAIFDTKSGDIIKEYWPRKSRENRGSLKNAAAGASKVVEAFFAGRKAREGSRPDYKAGARYETDGTNLIQWGSIIARKVNGSIEITDAGWRTKTTMAMLNAVLHRAAMNVQIYQKRNEWFMSTPGGTIPWEGSAVILPSGSIAGVSDQRPTEQRTLLNRKWRSRKNSLLKCCEKLGTGVPCAACGKHTHFDVEWLFPSRAGTDHRPACSSRCALKLKGKERGQMPLVNPASNLKNGRTWRVNIYDVWQDFGGPEEGGWWYTVGHPTGDFYPPRNWASARRLADKLNKSKEFKRDGLVARVEKGPGRSFPERRPHYENNGRGKRRNPLTRNESKVLISRAREAVAGSRGPSNQGRKFWLGRATGRAAAVVEFGPKRLRRRAAQLETSAYVRASNMPNGLSCLKNLHTARERAYAKKLIERYWQGGKAAIIAGNVKKAAHAYGALAAIRRIARFELPHAKTVSVLATMRMELLRQNAKDLAQYRKGGR